MRISPSYIITIVKIFLAMLGAWQIDHAFAHYIWASNNTLEILRFFTIIVYLKEQDFWILCIFTLLLAVFLPEIYAIMRRLLRRRYNVSSQQAK